MNNIKNLEQLTKEISDNLIEAISILEVLEDIEEISALKVKALIDIVKKDVVFSFDNIEDCRNIISIPD